LLKEQYTSSEHLPDVGHQSIEILSVIVWQRVGQENCRWNNHKVEAAKEEELAIDLRRALRNLALILSIAIDKVPKQTETEEDEYEPLDA